jgi:hypothetical protein
VTNELVENETVELARVHRAAIGPPKEIMRGGDMEHELATARLSAWIVQKLKFIWCFLP